MISQASLEEAILALLCFSSEQAPLLVLKLTDFKLFSNPTNQKLAEVAIAYINKFSSAPGAQLEYLLEADIRRGENGKLITQSMEFLSKQVDQIQPAFVISELDQFIAIRKMQKSLEEAMEHLNEGNLEEARSTVYKQSVQVKHSPGIWLHKPNEAFRFLDREEHGDFFSSGVGALDDSGILPARKELIFLIAATGMGKSWWLTEVGKSAIQHHKKVLHVTLELSEEETACRYLQAMFSLTREQAENVRAPYFERDEQGGIRFEFRDFQRDSVVTQRPIVAQKLAAWGTPKILIKEFPTSTLTTEQLALYIDSQENENGFVPDILLLDYVDLMRIDAASLRIDTGRQYRELRGLGVIKNMAVASASQGNRDSVTAKVVGATNVAEDWSKIGTGDGVLTFSQTPEEHRLGLARILVAKYRRRADKFQVLISQNYRIGQFCLDSIRMNAAVYNQMNALTQPAAPTT